MRFLLALRQIFVDDTDQLSSMRVCCVLVTVIVLGVWVWGKALENIEKLSRSMNNYLLTHGVKR